MTVIECFLGKEEEAKRRASNRFLFRLPPNLKKKGGLNDDVKIMNLKRAVFHFPVPYKCNCNAVMHF